MGTQYVLDTNTVIDFSTQKLPDKAQKKLSVIIDNSPKISIINKIELLSISTVSRQIVFFTEKASIIPLTEDIVNKTIDLRKKHKIKIPELL
jgi:predicted nucleic acid-binding protein